MTTASTPHAGRIARGGRAGGFWGFEFGAFGPLAVRRERVPLSLARPASLLYASDLHLGHWWTAGVPAQLLAVVRATRPEVILLGGDLADRHHGLAELHALTKALVAQGTVCAIPGNHDERTGLNEVSAAVVSAGAHWLPDRPLREPIAIDAALLPNAASRPLLLCAHYPTVFPAAVAAGYRLILAGHLHGGQCVLATYHDKLYPAAWFHRWHGLRFTEGGSLMLVSRGVADTFPFRFNCPREVLLCDLC